MARKGSRSPCQSAYLDRRKGVVNSSTVDFAVHLGARDGPDYIPTPRSRVSSRCAAVQSEPSDVLTACGQWRKVPVDT